MGVPTEYAQEDWDFGDLGGMLHYCEVLDVDDDGANEIVFTTYKQNATTLENVTVYVYIYDAETHVREWKSPRLDALSYNFYVKNIDDDPAMEIIIIKLWYPQPQYYSQFIIYDGATHSEEWCSPVFDEQVQWNIYCKDIDSDGDKELVFMVRNPTVPGYGAYAYIFSIDPYVQLWKSPMFFYPYLDLDVTDVDGDSALELVVVSSVPWGQYNSQGQIWVFDGDSHQQEWTSGDQQRALYLQDIADLDGDGSSEIVVYSHHLIDAIEGRYEAIVHVWDCGTHSLEWQSRNFTGDYNEGVGIAASLADLEGDGVMEVVVSASIYNYTLNTVRGYLDIHDGDTYSMEYSNSDLGGVVPLPTRYIGNLTCALDVDGDSTREFLFIVQSAVSSLGTVQLCILDGDTKTLEHTSEPFELEDGAVFAGNQMLVTEDCDNDGDEEIYLCVNERIKYTYKTTVLRFLGDTYGLDWSRAVPNGTQCRAIIFTDLNDDGCRELMALPTNFYNDPVKVMDPDDGESVWSSGDFLTTEYHSIHRDFEGDGLVEIIGMTGDNITILQFGDGSPALADPMDDIVIYEDSEAWPFNLFDVFSRMGSNVSGFGCAETGHVEVSILANGTLWLKPQPNWFGEESILITATNGFGNASGGFILTVWPVNDLPQIESIDGLAVKQGEWLNRTVSGNDTLDGLPVEFHDNCTLFDIDEDSGAISFLPANSDVGAYPLSIWVKDENNTYAYTNFTLTVENVNDPPVLMTIDGEDAWGGGTDGNGYGPGSALDPVLLEATEEHWYNFTATAEDIDETELNLDENLLFSTNLTDDLDNVDIDPETGVLSFLPTQDDVDRNGGDVHGRVVVTDKWGREGVAHFIIHVENVNDLPTTPFFTWDVADTYPQTPEKENLTVTFTGVPSTDSDGDPLEYTWDFDDGTSSIDDGPLAPIHTFPEDGTYNVSLTVSDGNGGEAEYVEQVTVTTFEPQGGEDEVEDETGSEEEVEDEPEEEEDEVGGTEEGARDDPDAGWLRGDLGKYLLLLAMVIVLCLVMAWVFFRKHRTKGDLTEGVAGKQGMSPAEEVLNPEIDKDPGGPGFPDDSSASSTGVTDPDPASVLIPAPVVMAKSGAPLVPAPRAVPLPLPAGADPPAALLLPPASGDPAASSEPPGLPGDDRGLQRTVVDDLRRITTDDLESPSDDAVRTLLEDKYRRGELSEDTYSFIAEEFMSAPVIKETNPPAT